METGILNSMIKEEEQFSIRGSASHDSESPHWSGDTVGNGSHLSPESEEGPGEDFDRTLSDWRRHVASLPMSDSEDYIVNDVLNETTPSPCKTDKFSFSPESLSPDKPENIVISNNSIHKGKVRGDNRMMDNDNTSGSTGNFYATIDSVVYEFGSDPSEKYITYHTNSELEDHNFISSPIQVISINPDTLDILDTSSEGSMESSRCGSPYSSQSVDGESSNHFQMQECNVNSPAYCNNDEDADYAEADDENDNIVDRMSPRSVCYNSSIVIESPTVDNSALHDMNDDCNVRPLPVLNCSVTPETPFSRRQKLKSVSLPQSPSRASDSQGMEFQPSVTFEDLKLVDFDRMFNLSPIKVFNKNYEMPDVFYENAAPFSETVSFDPIINIKVEKESGVALKSIDSCELEESRTANDIIGIIDKNSMLEKVMDSSDLLFNTKMEDCDLVEDINNFDLPSFIMDDVSASDLLKDNFISSPLMMKSKLKEGSEKQLDDFDDHVSKFETDMINMSSDMTSTPKQKTTTLETKVINFKEEWPQRIDTSKINLSETPVKLKSRLSKYPNDSLVMRITKSDEDKTPKDDSEDFVDVETVSDGECFPILAANNLHSLLEQFEASEKISHRLNAGGGVKEEPSQITYDLTPDSWSQQPETSHQKFPAARILELSPCGSAPDLLDSVSPSASAHNCSSESVQLDHDYCSPIRRRSGHIRTLCGSTEGDTSILDDSFVSPKPSCITTFYKQINGNANRMLGLGKGKNIAMCMEHRTDEFRENLEITNSILIKTPKKQDSLLKVNEAPSNPGQSDVSDSDCSTSDHCYSKADSKDYKFVTPIKSERSPLNVNRSRCIIKPQIIPSKVNGSMSDATVKNVENCLLVPVKNEVDLKKNIPKVNKNSLLITNFNSNCDKIVSNLYRRSILQADSDKSLLKQKQSLLKPVVKEEIKQVSLLKCNLVEYKQVPPPEKNANIKVERRDEVVLKSSENVPVKEVATVKTFEICADEGAAVAAPNQPKENNAEVVKQVEKKQPLKRKLNLEEYKKRREGSTKSCETSRTSSPVADSWALSSPNSPASVNLPAKAEVIAEQAPSLTEMLQNILSNSKHRPELPAEKDKETPVTSPDKKETTPESETKLYDPIAEASKKAIKLKKLATRHCLEDKIVQSKIPKLENVVILPIVTENGKVLPMIKNVEDVAAEALITAPLRRKNSEYEEIVMVSIGVNTNPVTFLEPTPDEIDELPFSEDLLVNDDSVKNGIQFTIKKKSNVIHKNVFDKPTVDLPQTVRIEKAAEVKVSEEVQSGEHLKNSHSKNKRQEEKLESYKKRSDSKDLKICIAKSNAMKVTLNTLNATLQKVEMTKDFKISSNSLLASIQKVVRKKNSDIGSPENNNHNHSSKHYSDKEKQSLDHRTERTKHPDCSEKHAAELNQKKNSKQSDNKHSVNVGNNKMMETDPGEKIQLTTVEKIKALDQAFTMENAKNKVDHKKPSPKPKKEIFKSPASDSVIEKSPPSRISPLDDSAKIEPTILDHGEDKVIMHLKKDRPRPVMCSLSVQTDTTIIQDEEIISSPPANDVAADVPHKIEDPPSLSSGPKQGSTEESVCSSDVLNGGEETTRISEKQERTYRKRKDTSSSECSIENGHKQSNYKYCREYSTSSKRTNSVERYRRSYSPSSGKYRSHSPSFYRYKKSRRTSYRNGDSKYNRRSRSVSRDKRRRMYSRGSYDRTFSSNHLEWKQSRSSGYHCDNRSVRSVPLSLKRCRMSSRSPKRKQRDSTERQVTKRHAGNGYHSEKMGIYDYERMQGEIRKSEISTSGVSEGCETNGYRNERKRLSTERSAKSRSPSSVSSKRSGSSRSSSSSSSTSSSSSSSYDSEASSNFHSSQENLSQKSYHFNNIGEQGHKSRVHPHTQRKAEPIEERRVVFIGRLEPELTKEDLRRKFVKYGQVMEVTLHRKDDGTRYGFVTFSKAEQSYRVVEGANLDADLLRYDVSFGGRRAFCRHLYSDLDDLETLEDMDYYGGIVHRPPPPRSAPNFDSLLMEMKMVVQAKKAREKDSPDS